MSTTEIRLLSLYSLLLLIGACSSDEPVSTSGTLAIESTDVGVEISVLSTKPWLVTGGDALVEVNIAQDENPSDISIALNGRDISNQFVSVSSHRRQALLSDLPLGDSEIAARLSGNGDVSTLVVSNYPASGPIISGPHQTPFVCQTNDFTLTTGELLGPPKDDSCSADTRVDYVYWSQDSAEFKPYPDLSINDLPDDMAYLDDELERPFIVRVETGTVNRAVYEISMLHNPAEGSVNPWNPSASWNKKLVYTHGGGCRSGWYQQGTVTGGVLNKGLLERGYALASSSLNVFGQNCNDLLASETHIMLKELFIEHYGVPVYTVSTGASGGSYQSHQTADNYPGIFDGIIVGLSFPDVTSATIFTLADARLLNYYFTEINPADFTVEQQQAVSGFAVHDSIANLSRGAARLDPLYQEEDVAEEQGSELSVSELEIERYSESNLAGLRATVYDHSVNVYGRVGNTDIAQRPLDNVGVQYGLKALNEGVISPQQFIDLNRDIGGFDRDMRHIPARHQADEYATKQAFESGRILFGGAGLAETPIIDYRSYLDLREGGDIHMIVHQYSTRARLINANGHGDNQVMLVGGRWDFTEAEPDLGGLFESMDSWILAIQRDTTTADKADKVVSNKPTELSDACWDNTSSPRVKITQRQQYSGDSECATLYPAYPTPRQVAGAPLANDIVSCRLRPLSAADYLVDFTPEQFAELSGIFLNGICDWSAADKHGKTHQGTWLSYGPSPVNRLQ